MEELPSRYHSVLLGRESGTSPGYPLRPEAIESCYYLLRTTERRALA